VAAVTVHTPVEGFTGSVAGVEFVDGVGSCDSRVALDYFRRHSYRIGAVANESPAEKGDGAAGDPPAPAPEPAPEPPARSANKPEWEAYAVACGGDPTGLTKDQIIDTYGGEG